ncbi:uncharacterized protein ACIQIH_000919 [Cyanocitta cristata]
MLAENKQVNALVDFTLEDSEMHQEHESGAVGREDDEPQAESDLDAPPSLPETRQGDGEEVTVLEAQRTEVMAAAQSLAQRVPERKRKREGKESEQRPGQKTGNTSRKRKGGGHTKEDWRNAGSSGSSRSPATPGHPAPRAPAGFAGWAAWTASSWAWNSPGEEELPPLDLDLVLETLEEMLSSSLPERSPLAQDNSGGEAVRKAAAEGALTGTESCRNSSLEPEEPDIHLIYLSRRAALRGEKRPRESL